MAYSTARRTLVPIASVSMDSRLRPRPREQLWSRARGTRLTKSLAFFWYVIQQTRFYNLRKLTAVYSMSPET
jgi:hypothetical protein